MAAREDQVRTGPAESLQFSEADWLVDITRERFDVEPFDERVDRTIKDLVELRGISYTTAAEFLNSEVKAGRLARRMVIVSGKWTAVYRPSSPPR